MSSWGSDILQGTIAGNQIASPIADAIRFKAQQAMEQKRMDQSADFQRQGLGLQAAQLQLTQQRAKNDALNEWAKGISLDQNGQLDPNTYQTALHWAQANNYNPLDNNSPIAEGKRPSVTSGQQSLSQGQGLAPETQNALANTKVSYTDPNTGMKLNTTGDHAATLMQDPSIKSFLGKAGTSSQQSPIPQAQALPQNIVPQQSVEDLNGSLQQRLAQRDAQKTEAYNLLKQGQISQMDYNKLIQGAMLEDKQSIIEKRRMDAAIAQKNAEDQDQSRQDSRFMAALNAQQQGINGNVPAFSKEDLQKMSLPDLMNQMKTVNPGQLPPLKENQSQDYGYGQRMVYNEQVLNDLLNKTDKSGKPVFNPAGTTAYAQSFGMYPEMGKSAEYKTYEQAARNWVGALLRKESGAAISNAEYDQGLKQYFPLPGDTQEIMDQKSIRRQQALGGMISALPTQYQRKLLTSPKQETPTEKKQKENSTGASYIESILK